MFGTYRTILALLVAFYHLYAEIVVGKFAVFGFFVLSGYLMTLIMQNGYGYNTAGRLRFGINRFLRLYPAYWIACVLSLVLILIFGEEFTSSFGTSIVLPRNFWESLFNFSMIFPYLDIAGNYPRLVEPAWALTVEMFFYIIICFGASRNLQRVKWWILLSVGYVVGTYLLGYSAGTRYFHIPAASLPFSLGALVYFLSCDNSFKSKTEWLKSSATLCLILYLLNALFWLAYEWYQGDNWICEIGFYLNLILAATFTLSMAMGGQLRVISKKVDSLLGDLSYPVYLMHYQVGILVGFWMVGGSFYHQFNILGLSALAISMIWTLLISYAYVRLVDHPIQRLRTHIKRKGT